MTEELENIIKTKSYKNLSQLELKEMEGFVENEADFFALKAVLLNVAETPKGVEVSSSVKESLDTLFETTYAKEVKQPWYKSLGEFLWPTEKILFAKPAFQLAALALLITVGINYINLPGPSANIAQYEKKTEDLEKSKNNLTKAKQKVNKHEAELVDDTKYKVPNVKEEGVSTAKIVQDKLTEESKLISANVSDENFDEAKSASRSLEKSPTLLSNSTTNKNNLPEGNVAKKPGTSIATTPLFNHPDLFFENEEVLDEERKDMGLAYSNEVKIVQYTTANSQKEEVLDLLTSLY